PSSRRRPARMARCRRTRWWACPRLPAGAARCTWPAGRRWWAPPTACSRTSRCDGRARRPARRPPAARRGSLRASLDDQGAAHAGVHAAGELVLTGLELVDARDGGRLAEADELAVEERIAIRPLVGCGDVVLDDVEVDERQR